MGIAPPRKSKKQLQIEEMNNCIKETMEECPEFLIAYRNALSSVTSEDIPKGTSIDDLIKKQDSLSPVQGELFLFHLEIRLSLILDEDQKEK